MNVMLEFENACPEGQDVPSEEEFQNWVNAALREGATISDNKPTVVGIKLVNEAESALLNQQYRHKDYATNVLSFANDLPEFMLTSLDEIPIGDLAICAPIVEREALEQKKNAQAHWAHMVIHGILHLQGYDHENDDDANTMETLECRILARLGYDDPYSEAEPTN